METRKQRCKKRNKRMKILYASLIFILIGLIILGGIRLFEKSNVTKSKGDKEIVKVEKKDNLHEDNNKVSEEVINNKEEDKSEVYEEKDEIGEYEEIVNPQNKTYTYGKYSLQESFVSNEDINFWFGRNDKFERPVSPLTESEISSFNVRYIGNNENIIYLTFDEGLNNTQAIKNLDTLKKYNIKGTFFLTDGFIKANPDIVKRMREEGHICGNHTLNHPNMGSLAKNNPEGFIKEIAATEDTFRTVTGTEMDKVIRFPEGTYSALALDYASQLGYRTVFWSFAYKDWSAEWNSTEEALNWMKSYYHPGAIYLLHGVNEANANALGDFIEFMKSNGYSFDVPTNIA